MRGERIRQSRKSIAPQVLNNKNLPQSGAKPRAPQVGNKSPRRSAPRRSALSTMPKLRFGRGTRDSSSPHKVVLCGDPIYWGDGTPRRAEEKTRKGARHRTAEGEARSGKKD